jgi:hypothetical protein
MTALYRSGTFGGARSRTGSGTHDIFQPRLEVVAEQKHPDRFPSHARNQPFLYRLPGHQPHRPAGVAFRRVPSALQKRSQRQSQDESSVHLHSFVIASS